MLAYDDAGSGEPIVLLHGLGTTRLIWRRVTPLLPGRRIIAVDVPGFGASPPAGPGFDLEQVADAVLAGLPTQEPFTLVGHSMGGAVALTLAVRAPERVRNLVLCAPAGLHPIPARAAPALGWLGEATLHLRRSAAPLSQSPLGRRLLLGAGTFDGAALDPADVEAMVTASEGATRIAEALATVSGADLRPLLAEAPAALGLLWGAHDRVISPDLIDVVLERRPDAVAELVPRTGHIAMMERPHAFAAMLSQILARLDAVHR